MNLLSLDTSTSVGSLSITSYSDNTLTTLATKMWSKKNTHSDIITLMLSEALTDAKINFADLDYLAVGVGPGSFTGLRVSINLIRTLAYSLNLPILPLNSLEILSFAALQKAEKTICIMRAFRNLVYCAVYERQTTNPTQLPIEVIPPKALTFEEVDKLITGPTLCVGNAYDVIKNHLPAALKNKLIVDTALTQTPQSLDLCQLAINKNPDKIKIQWNQLKPLYLRGSEAEEKLKNGLLKPILNF